MTDIELLPKSGKDTSLVTSFRSISLLSFIGNVFENVVHKLLLYEVSDKNLLHPNQFGFHAGLSLERSVLKLVSKIKTSIVVGNYAVVISYDIRGAFKNCRLPAIINILK